MEDEDLLFLFCIVNTMAADDWVMWAAEPVIIISKDIDLP